jgi:hypothetical protein
MVGRRTILACAPRLARHGAACLIALGLAACAYPAQVSTLSVDQKQAEFDAMIYLVGVACVPDNAEAGVRGPRSQSGCPPIGLRRLREFLAERSRARALSAYFRDNGASCRSAAAAFTCGYDKTIAATGAVSRVWSRALDAGTAERFELVASFPASDRALGPDQIDVALRRYSQLN